MSILSQNTLFILQKAAESALPAAPRQPNPAPKTPKTPSFTTKPPTIGKAVANVRPGFASSVTTQTQSLGTAKSPNAKQVSVSKPVMTVREFRTAAPAIPFAKTAQSIACGGGPCWGGNAGALDTSTWTKADWRRYFGIMAAAPAVAAAAPAVGGATTVGAGVKALGSALLAAFGGYGAGTGAFDAADKVRTGDYGGAVRDAAGAVISGTFPYADKASAAMTALRGAAGTLGATDLGRAIVYGREGMPGAAGAAATRAVADLSLLVPWSKYLRMLRPAAGIPSAVRRTESLRTVLPAVGVWSVANLAEERLAQDAFNDRVKAVYDKALGPTVEAAKARFADAGVPDAAGVAQDLGAAASEAAHVTDTAQPFSPTFLSGLTATKDLQYVKALEREAAQGHGTVGSRSAATNVRALIDRILGKPGSLKAHLTSASGWLFRNGKWVLPAVGALTAGAAGLKLYNVIKARRKKKEQQ